MRLDLETEGLLMQAKHNSGTKNKNKTIDSRLINSVNLPSNR